MNEPKPFGSDRESRRLAAATSAIESSTSTLRSSRLGICTYSYGFHWKAAREGHSGARFKDVLGLLDHCKEIGAGGVQIGLANQDSDYARQVHARSEAHKLFYEGLTSLPKDGADLARFEKEIVLMKEAGAKVIRTACLSGRRYETFDSTESFQDFERRSWNSLTLAEPVMRKERCRLAVENHKDWSAEELAARLKRLGSEWIGACVDIGNNIALLEDPATVVETLAPYAFTTHIKDMGVAECPEGFLLAEVPLGNGFLELPKLVSLLTKANPNIQFNLEMITRDPLLIPCLTDNYWATFPLARASQLAAAVRMVKGHQRRDPLPKTTGLTLEQQLTMEGDNVLKSLSYWRKSISG